MLESIKKKWNIDLKKSFMIGDKLSDRGAQEKAILTFFILIKTYLFQQKKI